MRLVIYVLVAVLALAIIGAVLENNDPIRPGPSTNTPETGRYTSCEEATAAVGPGPYREGTPGYDPYLDHDMDKISCEE